MVALPVIIALLGLTNAIMGAYMSGRRHPIWLAVFIVFGLTGSVLVGVQSWKASDAQDALRVSIQKIPKNIRDEFLKSGGTVTLSEEARPWWLTPEQIYMLANEMRPFADGSRVVGLVNIASYDADSRRLAEDFVSAFRAAGWNLPEDAVTGLGPNYKRQYREGIYLMVHSDGSSPKGLAELRGALQKFAMEPTPFVDEKLPEDRFRILIGARPKN